MEVDDDLHTLLAEQRRELSSAIAADSDLNYAFQLQVQEAITASLPPSAASSSKPPLPVVTDDDLATSSPGMAQLLADEIANYERERSDREIVELEARQMRENLDRLIHDQAFARDILNVPEVVWKKTGDWIEKPYGEGSSSSSSSSGGSFRVYFKGLVVKQGDKVRDVMTLAGIGVVICDTSDCPVFELRKPLDLADGEATEDVVEVKALIEGLSVAVTLGLKRINIFLDDYSLYQYGKLDVVVGSEQERGGGRVLMNAIVEILLGHLVTGARLPRQNKIFNLVDEVKVLQRKFVSCSASLVGQKEVRFAFKLARDAMVSQANKHGKNLTETCTICTEDTDMANIIYIDSCLHRYCFSCMKQHTEYKLLQGKLPECPHEGCKTEMKIETCRKFLTPEMYDIMSQRIKEASIPTTEKIYCPYPSCSALMSKCEVQGYAAHLSYDAQQAGARKCTRCQGFFCISCKVPWHVNMTCFDYKMQHPHASREDAKLKSLATQNRWRQCGKCSHMVELARGCYHISCRCGHEFCYTCGAEWKKKKATCKCPIWDERNIVYAEHDRRRQRRG